MLQNTKCQKKSVYIEVIGKHWDLNYFLPQLDFYLVVLAIIHSRDL